MKYFLIILIGFITAGLINVLFFLGGNQYVVGEKLANMTACCFVVIGCSVLAAVSSYKYDKTNKEK